MDLYGSAKKKENNLPNTSFSKDLEAEKSQVTRTTKDVFMFVVWIKEQGFRDYLLVWIVSF